MGKAVVIIPVYKTFLEQDEQISLKQTLNVLGKYPITIICPSDIGNTFFLEDFASVFNVNLKFEFFDPEFFKDIKGYNRLLLSEGFYQRFSEYEYMLICQLDAYVFRDELREWCEKDYDFIGAPLFGKFTDTEFHQDQAVVGNGGFSLRKTKAYLDFFQGKKNVFKTKDLAKRINFWKKPYTRWLVWLLMVLGWRNKPQSVAMLCKYNEDNFWSGTLAGSNYEMTKPLPIEALHFSFERFPSECYAITGSLPFGCHAWKKYQYEEFWKGKIG